MTSQAQADAASPIQHPLYICSFSAVAADQTVPGEEPDIAGERGRLLWNIRDVIGVGQACGAEAGQIPDLKIVEADQRQIEAERIRPSSRPSNSLSQPAFNTILLSAMMQARVCASLSPKSSIRHGVHAELAQGQQPAVAGDDTVSHPSTRTGFVQPNSRIEAAICATCTSEGWGRSSRKGSKPRQDGTPLRGEEGRFRNSQPEEQVTCSNQGLMQHRWGHKFHIGWIPTASISLHASAPTKAGLLRRYHGQLCRCNRCTSTRSLE
jgi:hypothetical protein